MNQGLINGAHIGAVSVGTYHETGTPVVLALDSIATRIAGVTELLHEVNHTTGLTLANIFGAQPADPRNDSQAKQQQPNSALDKIDFFLAQLHHAAVLALENARQVARIA